MLFLSFRTRCMRAQFLQKIRLYSRVHVWGPLFIIMPVSRPFYYRQKRSAFRKWKKRAKKLRRVEQAKLARQLQRLYRGRMGRRRAAKRKVEARKHQRRKEDQKQQKEKEKDRKKRARAERAVALLKANTESGASKTITRWFREALRVARVRRDALENRMAMRVQCAYRIRTGRFAAHMKRTARTAHEEEMQACAVLIQSVLRRSACYRRCAQLRATRDEQLDAALFLQSAMRKKISRTLFGLRFEKRKHFMRNQKDEERRNLVAKMQEKRGAREKKEATRAQLQARRLQNLQRKANADRYDAAVRIQNVYRLGKAGAYLKELKYKLRLFESTLKVQRYWRRRVWLVALSGRLQLRLDAMLLTKANAALLVQSAWRRKASYKVYQFSLENARAFELRTDSTATLQRAFRSRRARLAFGQKKVERDLLLQQQYEASRCVQSRFRGRLAKGEAQIRREQLRLHEILKHKSATAIQGIFRTKRGKDAAFARAAYLESVRLMREAKSTQIQAVVRSIYARRISLMRVKVLKTVKHEQESVSRPCFETSALHFLKAEATWSGCPPAVLTSLKEHLLVYDLHCKAQEAAAGCFQNRWRAHKSALFMETLRVAKRKQDSAEMKGAIALQKAWRARQGRWEFSNFAWSIKQEALQQQYLDEVKSKQEREQWIADLEERELRDEIMKQKKTELEIAQLKQQVELQALKDLLSSADSQEPSNSEDQAAKSDRAAKLRGEFPWEADWDENGYLFFRDKNTFATQWEEPLLYVTMLGKPCPWCEKKVESSSAEDDGYLQVYYFNRETFESVWDKVYLFFSRIDHF
jgi:hypothetical protein